MQNEFMYEAIKLAGEVKTDIPVGAVIVKDGQIISIGCNTKETDNDVTSHAEIIAIRNAEKKLGNWRLDGCDLYVTLEPCPMCGWAILQSRISNIYFGSYDNIYGAFSSNAQLHKLSDSKLKIYGGIMEDKCDKLLSDFFQKMRIQNKK